MKKFFKFILQIAIIFLSAAFLFSCCTSFIPSAVFSYTVFFALLFPYLFLLVLFVAIGQLFFNKKRAAFFFFLLSAGLYNLFHVVAVSPLSSWHNRKDTASLRIMTWNVSEFINPALFSFPESMPRKQILQTITEFNPDILCIQEYENVEGRRDVASVKHELDSIGYHHIYFSNDQVTKSYGGIDQRGTVIASKQPFMDTGRMLIRKDWRTEYLVYADFMINNKPMRVNTAHLTSFYLFPDSASGYNGEKTVAKKLYRYKRNVETKLRDIEKMHDKQAAQIRKFLDTSSYPNVYCGDCNAISTMYSYRILKGNSQDAFLTKGTGIGATFHNIVPTLRIDMCFPDNHFTIEQCTVIHRKLGDHYPVVTDIKWKTP